MDSNKTNIAIATAGFLVGGILLKKLYNYVGSTEKVEEISETPEEVEERLYDNLRELINEYESKYKTKLIIVTDFDIFFDERRHNLYQKRGEFPVMDIDDHEWFLDELLRVKTNRLDVMIQSSGGSITSSNAMVNALLHLPKNMVLHTHVPTYAYSAGCLLALCGHIIHTTPYTQFGPVDPQLAFRYKFDEDRYSARNIIEGLKYHPNKLKDISKIQLEMAKSYMKASEMITKKVLSSRNRHEDNIYKLTHGHLPHNEVFHRSDLNIKFDELNEDIKDIHFLMSALRDNSYYFPKKDDINEDEHEE